MTPPSAVPYRRYNKMGNVRSIGPDGKGGQRAYDSKIEAAHAFDLELLQEAGEIVGFTPQFSIPIVLNGVEFRTNLRRTPHRVDFLVTYPDGHKEIHELKGRRDSSDPAYKLWCLKRFITEQVWMPEHPEVTKYVVLP